MKPSQFIESGLPGKRIVRRFPLTDWNYRAVGFPNFKSRCAGTPRSSFAEISRDYFNSEARRGFVFELVLFALARCIEGKDPNTEGHCERLCGYSVRLGKEIGLPEEQLVALRRAGIVHDIGKVAVPETILLKPGRLTPEEFLVMQHHPVLGERICAPLKSFRLVLPIIRHHHEKLDGSGYPDRLKGEEIPLTARVLQIVDVYDALTTDRPYKSAFASVKALEIMEDEVNKGWWDSRIFGEFKRLVASGEWADQTRSAAAGQ